MGLVRAPHDYFPLRAVLRFVGQEHRDERVRRITDLGRRAHRTWAENVFAPQLQTHAEQDREALTDLPVVATDVYTWKLLRRDRELSREQVEAHMRRMIDALLTRRKEQSR